MKGLVFKESHGDAFGEGVKYKDFFHSLMRSELATDVGR